MQIPGRDFQGAGLDIRRVVETGITPLINTGIAHKRGGDSGRSARHCAGTAGRVSTGAGSTG
ncbi:hypothetical protein ACVXHA_01240 [Escherichia coli]